MSTALRTCRVYNLLPSGQHDYLKVWRYQKSLMNYTWKTRKDNQPTKDNLIFVQHKNVYTLGKGADKKSNLLFNPKENQDIMIYNIERGGEITWHGTGQLVCYPIIDLNSHKKDLKWYINMLENAIINVLGKHYFIKASRNKLNPGVWVDLNDIFINNNIHINSSNEKFVNNVKICAVGITASRWITMHGLAINLNSDLRNILQYIVPCGISSSDGGVCSLHNLMKLRENNGQNKIIDIEEEEKGEIKKTQGEDISLFLFQQQLQEELANIFNFTTIETSSEPEEELESFVKDFLNADEVQIPTRYMGEDF